MNLYTPEKPYRFYPARYSPVWAPLLVAAGRALLRPHFAVRSIRVEGIDPVLRLHRAGHALLLAPNHADHADPTVMLVAGRRHGLAFQFMAARDTFDKGRLSAFVLQRVGAFSVDREGADVSAIKAALSTLRESRNPLVIYPEGEVYHHHERLDDLNEGVALIGLRAAEGMPEGRRGYLVPVGLRFTHVLDVAHTFPERLARLEQRIWWKPRPDLPLVDRIHRLAGGLLAIKEEEYLGGAIGAPLPERIATLQLRLVELVERRLESPAAPGTRIPERVKRLRLHIRRRLHDPDRPPTDAERDRIHDDLDALFLVVQAYSYPLPYLQTAPTVDRIAETIFKLEEDVLGEGTYAGLRDAVVRFGAPIDIAAFARERHLTAKTAVAPLTRALADAIQALLETPA